MISLTSKSTDAAILEPSSGEGAFLDALYAAGFENVIGVEIDPEIAHHDRYPVVNSSYITWETNEKFDLVIGNPPYIRWKDLDQVQKDELVQHRLFGSMLNSLSDYLLPFIALSIEKLSDGGELIFITPSFWLQTKHSESLRDYLGLHGAITNIVDFGEAKIFKDVTTSLVVFKFVKTNKKLPVVLHRYLGGRVSVNALDLGNPNLFRSEVISNLKTNGKFVTAFDNEVQEPLALEKDCLVEGRTTQLGEFVRIANGMVTGLDEAFRLGPEFVDSLSERELMGVSRIIKGKDLQQLYSPGFSYYIDIDPGMTEEEVLDQFPNLLEVLKPWREKLELRYATNKEHNWWNWSFYRSEIFHRSPITKGFVPGKERLTNKLQVRFSLASNGALATQDVTAFAPLPNTREHIYYIVAYLNLRAVSSWIRTFGLMKGGVAEFSEKPLSEIPFRCIDWENPLEVETHTKICNLIESIVLGADPNLVEYEIFNHFSTLIPSLRLPQ